MVSSMSFGVPKEQMEILPRRESAYKRNLLKRIINRRSEFNGSLDGSY